MYARRHTSGVKRQVQANFDASPDAYERYERATGRFEALAERLFAAMRERSRAPIDRVVDAGAGSGASTPVFERANSTVLALDLSAGMLRANPARHRLQADFDALPLADESVDAVAYTASLFLTPEPARTVREAHRIVRPGGTIGAVAPLGWTRPDGTDVFESVGRRSRSPASTDAVEAALRDALAVTEGTWTFETSGRNLRRFHAVPAMAARLYPKADAEQRVANATDLLADVEGPLRQHWRWFVGTRD
jgi:SAM-dependent methyltransferase